MTYVCLKVLKAHVLLLTAMYARKHFSKKQYKRTVVKQRRRSTFLLIALCYNHRHGVEVGLESNSFILEGAVDDSIGRTLKLTYTNVVAMQIKNWL